MLKDNLRAFGKQAASLAYPTENYIELEVANGTWWQSYVPPSDGIFTLVSKGGTPLAEIQGVTYSRGSTGDNTTAAVWCLAKKGIPIYYASGFTSRCFARFYPAKYA